jgi:predicted ATP-grasp superfamily ATP-dependent carboligase
MSEVTRAQLRSLLKRAAELIQQSQDIRRQLEQVMERVEKTGVARESARETRPSVAKRKDRK